MDPDVTTSEPIATGLSALQESIDRGFGGLQGEIENLASTHKGMYEKVEQENRNLKDEIQKLKANEAREERVVALIDGDGTIFLPSLIAQGKKGGHEAASRLTGGIKAHLDPHQFQLHVYVFHNKRGLKTALYKGGYERAATKLDDFTVGFNEGAKRFAIIDAGHLKEGSDHKLRAYLDDYIGSARTLKVLFGGCHDSGYVTELNSLITSGYKQKLILLPGYANMHEEVKKLGLPSLVIPDLFLAEKMQSQLHDKEGEGKKKVNLDGTQQTGQRINPNLAMLKQKPPLCIWFHLANCKHGLGCRFAHDYELSEAEKETLCTAAKNIPCGTIIKGEKCTWGTDCVYGHVCPNSPDCSHLKCKFSGEGMHPVA